MLSLTENKMHGFFDFKFFLRQGVQNWPAFIYL
jgi:hypothetical protein